MENTDKEKIPVKAKKSKKKNIRFWLTNLYYIGTLLTLFFIMAQVFYAKRTMNKTSEWEKAKVTIENIERFKEKLSETALYDKTKSLQFADGFWPDFTTQAGWESSDTLRKIHLSITNNDDINMSTDIEKTLAIMNNFAYPIIMGYANEMESFQSAIYEYYRYGNYIMPYAFHTYKRIGHHAKLLYRLWRVRTEQLIIIDVHGNEIEHLEFLNEKIDKMLCFESTEVTPATLKQYERKLEKELIKIQKEILAFRKKSMR